MPARTITILCITFILIFSGVASAEKPVDGKLSCFAFYQGKGTPLSGAAVEIEGVGSFTTNADGVTHIKLPQGKYNLHYSHPEAGQAEISEVWVFAGETSEVIVSMSPDAPATVDVEVPEAQVAASAFGQDDPQASKSDTLVTLSGQIIATETGEPVKGARIFVRGHSAQGRTDDAGKFQLEIPEGPYALSIIHPDFSTQTVDGEQYAKDAPQPVKVELAPNALSLSDYTVTAPQVEGGLASMLEQRRNSGAVSDVIGAEQIAKSGDSNAAAALKRVTGLTVVGGKYVYVRGMGERYSSSLINGSTLPSPEPERRVVPLDMFPADLFQGVIVQKTYTPDMPGEFGGGVIQLQTKGVPDALVLDVGISGGYKVNTTGKRGLMYEGGSTDWLGIDDGSRQLPASISNASKDQLLLERDRFSDKGYTKEKLEQYGEAMPNNWNLDRDAVPMDAGMNLTAGYGFKAGIVKLGFLGGLTYSNDWDLTRTQRNYYIVGAGHQLELQHTYDFETLENGVDLGGIFNFGIKITEDHEIQSTTLLMRTTDNETRVYHGPNRDVATDIEVSRLRWLERQLLFQQASGKHVIPPAMNFEIDWRYAYSQATREEPDRREVRYDLENTTNRWILSDRPEGNQRLFSELEDINHDAGLDFILPFNVWQNLEAKVKVGGNYVTRKREVDTRRFKFMHKGERSTNPDILAQSPEEIFSKENIGPDGFQFEEITRQTDNYKADQLIQALYGMLDFPTIEQLRIVGGARFEKSEQNVETFELFNPDFEPIVADLATEDILPAANVTYNFWGDMLLRAGYSKTVSRPDFRELSEATFNDVTGGRQVFGNPDLERAMIDNMDMRWEWYLSEEESISFGFFYKKFDKPIETIVVPSAQFSVTYENADSAENYGLELDFRKNFDFITDKLEPMYIAGNAAWIQSKVELSDETGISTEDERPLQGQSPYAVNLSLGYDNEDIGTSTAVLYNVFGERIEEVGAGGAPDVVEEPFHQLDFVFAQGLPLGFKIKFKAKNLIDLEARKSQGDEITERYFKGREFSLGLSWRY